MSLLENWLNSSGRDALVKAGRSKWLHRYVDNGTAKIETRHVFDALYDSLRGAKYPPSPRNDLAIEAFTGSSTPEISVLKQNQWHYRVPKNRTANGWSLSDKSVDRISLNVYAKGDLIQKLDDFMTRNKAYYKTPDQFSVWSDRHDPITIYFHEPLTAKLENELKQIVAPHVRGNDLIGRRIADGMYAQKSPQAHEIKALIARADALDPELGKAVTAKAHSMDFKTMKPRVDAVLSAGEMHVIEAALDDFEKFKALHTSQNPPHPGNPSPPPNQPSGPPSGGSTTQPAPGNTASTPADTSKRWSTGAKWAMGVGGAAAVAGGWVLYEKSRQENKDPAKDTSTPPM